MKTTLAVLAVAGGVLTGCGSTPSHCSTKGYKGIVVAINGSDISCSNGDKSPDGQSFISNDGNRNTKKYNFYLLQKDTK